MSCCITRSLMYVIKNRRTSDKKKTSNNDKKCFESKSLYSNQKSGDRTDFQNDLAKFISILS